MADLTTSQIFTDGERGITATKMNAIISGSTIQPAFYTSKPTAGTADPTDIALILKSGAYAQVPVSTLAGGATQAQIWSTRLRSFNAIGNPNFEVDQRNCNTALSYPAGNIAQFQCDKWYLSKVAATGAITAISNAYAIGGSLVPGTNFRISRSNLGINVSTSQATLAAGEAVYLTQYVEGPQWRELATDTHSISLLVQCSIASFPFSVSLRASGGTYSMVLPCVTPATANTMGIVTLPNLPVWTPSATWSALPGVFAYTLSVCLGAGTTFQAPSTGAWVAGNYFGYPGQPSFLAQPVNSQFFLGFVQHEPGPVCTTLMDKPFSQNLDECLRYYEKSYPYGVALGTVNSAGHVYFSAAAAQNPLIPIRFKKSDGQNSYGGCL